MSFSVWGNISPTFIPIQTPVLYITSRPIIGVISLKRDARYIALSVLESIIAMQIPISEIYYIYLFIFKEEMLFSVELRKRSWIQPTAVLQRVTLSRRT